MRIACFIPAIRAQARFHDDLLRKLDGIPLIQRAILKAQSLGGANQSIQVLTDSEEVALIARRNNADVFWQPDLQLENFQENKDLLQYLATAERDVQISALLSPYAPLLNSGTFHEALHVFLGKEIQILKPVRKVARRVIDDTSELVWRGFVGTAAAHHRLESSAFMLLRPGLLWRAPIPPVVIELFEADDSVFEIETLQDWWVCEKLLQRKRIVFRVIGNNRIGMGHVYRALSLAHELHDHEILFVTDTDNQAAVETIVRRDYWLGVYPRGQMIEELIRLRPDLVINDVLDTRKKDTEALKYSGAKVASFEDLGPGARCTDLTVNELYDEPQFDEGNVLWGRKYFFLRDEFALARPHRFSRRVSSIMLAFGGTDQHDLARKILHAVRPVCDKHGVFIHIVTGPGYRGYDRLMRQVEGNDKISLTHDSQVISGLMEQVQVAITSNGRTVYEFAHMNIPTIVIAQHERELTHAFASADNGFVPLGLYRPGITEKQARQALGKLLIDVESRKVLHECLKRHRFSGNKTRVLRLLNGLIKDKMPNGQPIGTGVS